MKFNPTKPTPGTETTTTPETPIENYEGGEAFPAASAERQLFMAVTGTLIEDQFYRDETEQLADLIAAVANCADEDPEFVLQTAAYARNVMGLRDAPQVILTVAAHIEATQPFVRDYTPSIIRRADEPMTILGIWNTLFAHRDTIPKPLKKGINDALVQFEPYHFAKYDSDRRTYNLRDVFNMTRPKAHSPERQEIHDRIMWGDLDEYPEVDPLDPPHTWEVIISEHGNTAEAWTMALPFMGLFARIRNIRNMLDAGIDGRDILGAPLRGTDYETGETFTFPGGEDGLTLDHVRNSRVFPFRFYQAYMALMRANLQNTAGADHVIDFLGDAVDVAADQLPDSLADTFVAVDLSGSMTSSLSRGSTMTYKEVACVFGGALARKGARVGGFADRFEPIRIHPDTPTLQAVDTIRRTNVGGSTNGWQAIEYLRDEAIDVDRVVFLTDMELYDSTGWGAGRASRRTVREEWDRYRATVNPDAFLYSIDLAGYPHLAFPESEPTVFEIGGWNSQVLDFIEYAERPAAQLSAIRAYEGPGR